MAEIRIKDSGETVVFFKRDLRQLASVLKQLDMCAKHLPETDVYIDARDALIRVINTHEDAFMEANNGDQQLVNIVLDATKNDPSLKTD